MALTIAPDLRDGAREIRKFVRRAVRFLVGAGIRQFVDIGCGLPTQGNVHEVAQGAAPDARIAYVDNDPVVISHARALLETNDRTAVVEADVREPDRLLADPALRRLIDFDQPVAILMISLLHFIPDDDEVHAIVDRFRTAVVPGSHLAISHAVADPRPEVTAKLAALYQQRTGVKGPHRANLRTKAEVEPFFANLDVVPPGVVYIAEWRPELADPLEPVGATWAVAGIGRTT
jgi:O-methyltransferase involved in polyketide biosynthesis